MYILGISAFYHDSAACLVKDGEIVAAAQEERFTRIKHDHSFPSNAINYCLKESGIDVTEIKFVSFYEKPFIKKWWLAPIIVFLVLFGALLVLTEGSAVAPFIYTLF